jgi:integrase
MVNIYFEEKRGYFITFRRNGKNFFRTLKGFKDKEADAEIVKSIAKVVDTVLVNQQRTNTVLNLLREVSRSVKISDFRLPIVDVWVQYLSRPNKKQNSIDTEKARGNKWQVFVRYITKEYPELLYLHEITPVHIQSYMDYLSKQLKSATTINNTIGSLSVVWQRLMIDYSIFLNPCKCVEKFKAVVIKKDNLTPEEISSLWLVAQSWASGEGSYTTQQKPFWAFAVATAYYTGLRIGDIANIKYDNLDLDNMILTITPHKTEKTNAKPLQHVIHPDMLKYIPLDRSSEYLYPYYANGCKTNASWFWAEQRNLFAEANIVTTKETHQGKRVTKGMHSLRVHYATTLLDCGVPLSDVQGGMGHSSPAMTASYNRTIDAGLKNAKKIKNIS